MPSLVKNSASQTFIEEIFNACTHGIGIILGVIALVILVVLSSMQGQAIKIISSAVYGTSLIILYTASTLYHSTQRPQLKHLFRIFDHTSIFILIAGSYTPFALVSMKGGWGWSMFGIIWGLAIIGIFFKSFFMGKLEWLSVGLYLLMGWLIVIAAVPLIHDVPFGGLIWLLIGGLFYTIGVIFYATDAKYYFSHFLWHLFVLAGSICQFFAILLYVVD